MLEQMSRSVERLEQRLSKLETSLCLLHPILETQEAQLRLFRVSIQDLFPVKYINARLYYPNIFADGTGTSSTRHTFNQGLVTSASYFQTRPQMLKVTNEKPQYAVQPLASTNTLGEEVYSNNPLALLSGAGRDNTVWHSFFARVDSFNPVARSVIVRGNVIFKVNITFEGIRWNPPALFLGTGEPFCDDVPSQSRDVSRRNRDCSEETPECESLCDWPLRVKRARRLGAALPLLHSVSTSTETLFGEGDVSCETPLAESD